MGNTVKKLLAFILVIVMLLSLTACVTFNRFKAAFIDKKEDGQQEPPTIKIGVLEPQTGVDAAVAADEIAGIELAHTMYPQALGRKIELIYSDNQSDVLLCSPAAQALVNQDVDFIIGSYKSVLTLASSDVIKNARIPAVAATNTNPLITSTNRYYFRVSVIDSFEGKSAASYVANGLKASNIAIFLREGNDYASYMAAVFKEALEKTGTEGAIVQSVIVPEGTENFSIYFRQLGLCNADIVYFPEDADIAKPILQAAADEGYKFKWLGTSRWKNLDFDGIYYTLDYDPDDSSRMAKAFRKAYAEKVKEANAEPSDAVALGFDAYLLILNAIYAAGPDASSQEYVDALGNITNMPGATGNISMGAGGDPIKEIIVKRYDKGALNTVYRAVFEQEARSEEE
jgi:branched-chain amino acid transport system substrate-binding protein